MIEIDEGRLLAVVTGVVCRSAAGKSVTKSSVQRRTRGCLCR